MNLPSPAPDASSAPRPPQKPQHNFILTTPRLRLRPVAPSDLETLHSFRRDPAVMVHMSTDADPEPVAALSATPARLTNMMAHGNRFTMAVELLSSPMEGAHTAIGFLGLHRNSEIFYIFGSPYWGRGYATEAVRAWMECYWREFPTGLEGMDEEAAGHLTAGFYEGNEASGRVMEKLGMRFVGLLKPGEGENNHDGKNRNVRVYRIERPVQKTEGKADGAV